MHLFVLGTPEVVVDGRSHTIAGSRRQGLLALLVVRRNREISVELLIDQLWADLAPDRAVRALRSEVHRLRPLLAACGTIETRPGGYRLAIDDDRLDLAHFETHVGQARRSLERSPAAARSSAEAGLQLWRGRPFGDLVEVDEVTAEQRRLEELCAQLQELRVTAWLATAGSSDELVAELTGLVTTHPERERLWATMLTALRSSGRHAEALAAFDVAAQALRSELGVEPSSALRQLALEIRADQREGAGNGLAIAGAHAHPQALIGRREELDALGAAIEGLRLVTLTGPGGVGKTRLAVAVAARQRTRFRDGTVFVDLARVSERRGVMAAVTAACGVGPDAGASAAAAIAAALARRETLLVLDNCEHVIEAAAELAQLVVRRTGSTVVLATSREPLGLPEEQVWAVEPLEPLTDAAELFRVRAAAADVHFRATAAEQVSIGELCVRLDGLPLAIELAAAQVRAFGVRQLVEQLAGSAVLELPAGRGRPRRHHTLRTTIAWSYELLSPPHQRLLQAASACAGTFDVGALAALSGAASGREVAGAVAALVDRSLLRRINTGDGARFAMLETIRQFASEKAEDSRSTSSLRRAHADHYARVVEQQGARCVSAAEPAAWHELAADWANIRLAFRTALDDGNSDLVATLCRSLTWYGLFSGNVEVGVWAREAVLSGLLDGHPAHSLVRGVWGVHAYWVAGDLAETGNAVGPWPPDGPGCAVHHLVTFMRAQALGQRELADQVSRAWAADPGDDPAAGVLAPAVRAYYGLWLDDPSVDTLRWCDVARNRANQLGAPSLQAYVMVCLAQVVGEREPGHAVELSDRAIACVAALPASGWIAVAPLCYRMAGHVRNDDVASATADTITVLERSRALQFRQSARFGLWAAALCLVRAGRRDEALALARRSGAHAGRSSLGLDRLLDDVFGSAWRRTLDGHGPEHLEELLDAVDDALAALSGLWSGVADVVVVE